MIQGTSRRNRWGDKRTRADKHIGGSSIFVDDISDTVTVVDIRSIFNKVGL